MKKKILSLFVTLAAIVMVSCNGGTNNQNSTIETSSENSIVGTWQRTDKSYMLVKIMGISNYRYYNDDMIWKFGKDGKLKARWKEEGSNESCECTYELNGDRILLNSNSGDDVLYSLSYPYYNIIELSRNKLVLEYVTNYGHEEFTHFEFKRK